MLSPLTQLLSVSGLPGTLLGERTLRGSVTAVHDGKTMRMEAATEGIRNLWAGGKGAA